MSYESLTCSEEYYWLQKNVTMLPKMTCDDTNSMYAIGEVWGSNEYAHPTSGVTHANYNGTYDSTCSMPYTYVHLPDYQTCMSDYEGGSFVMTCDFYIRYDEPDCKGLNHIIILIIMASFHLPSLIYHRPCSGVFYDS
jgi:hypothetical protein